MKLNDPHLVKPSTQSAVLLIFFMSRGSANLQGRVLLSTLADSLQRQFGSLLRVIRVDDATHPDVVHSFDITQTPAFVLVRQGIELWRQVGMSDEAKLVLQIRQLLTTELTKSQSII